MVLPFNTEVHKGGGPLGPMISFFVTPVKTRKDFFPLFFDNCPTIGYAFFDEKKN